MIVQTSEQDALAREIARLRAWEGEPREFWPRLAAVLAAASGASRSLVLIKGGDNGGGWKRIADHGQSSGPAPVLREFMRQQESLADGIGSDGEPRLTALAEVRAGGECPYALAIGFELRDARTVCVGLLLLTGIAEVQAREIARRVNLLRDIPRSFEMSRENIRARSDVERFAVVLDLQAAMDSETRFLAAGLAWVNALADRFKCDRASVGWLERTYVRLRVMSRTEHFNRQMAAAGALESVMEECLDQDEDIVYPAPEGSRSVCRDHERYAAEQRAGNVASFPLRLEGKAIAVLTCERASRPFDFAELQQLRLSTDLVARRLAELKRWDRWFGARWATGMRERSAGWLGPEHTGAKLLAVVITLALAALFFVPVPYRVEGKFQLRSDEVAYLTAPYEGYIKNVRVRPGDLVPAEGILLQLDTEELELEEMAARADMNRYQREAEKARATSALAEMRVAEALARQYQARLELARYRLDHATLRSPYASVVVEGDLRERVGAPVRQGDALFRVARLDKLYVEAEVDERDIHELTEAATGQIAFVSQPRLKFPIRVERIEPSAVPRKTENVFLARCILDAPPEGWWRPGMTGVCKLDAGRRSIAWIFTRRTVDFLRMFLWW
jgi:multidrug resistance efflux pump